MFQSLLKKIILRFIERYDECYIPDYPDEKNLSGILSHSPPLPHNIRYIGPLSRFVITPSDIRQEDYEIVILISGPEPQRTAFEERCRKLLKEKKSLACIIRGRPGNTQMKKEENIAVYDHVSDEQFVSILTSAGKIICRSGYSTIMDLHALKLKALLVPTEGQTEQEYLAEYHSCYNFEMKRQEDLTSEDFNSSSELYQAL